MSEVAILSSGEVVLCGFAAVYLSLLLWGTWYVVAPVKSSNRHSGRCSVDSFAYLSGLVLLVAVLLLQALWTALLAVGHLVPRSALQGLAVVPPLTHNVTTLLLVTLWRYLAVTIEVYLESPSYKMINMDQKGSGIFHDVVRRTPPAVVTGHVISWLLALLLFGGGMLSYWEVLSRKAEPVDQFGVLWYSKQEPVWGIAPAVASLTLQLCMGLMVVFLVRKIPRTVLQRSLHVKMGGCMFLGCLVAIIGKAIPEPLQLFAGNGAQMVYYLCLLMSERYLRHVREGRHAHYRSSSGSYIFE